MKLFQFLLLLMILFLSINLISFIEINVYSNDLIYYHQNHSRQNSFYQHHYPNHSEIRIENDSDFLNQASIEGWSGNGTKLFPFILENFHIKSESYAIQIKNVKFFFLIQNSIFIGNGNISKSGIFLNQVSNGIINNNMLFSFGSAAILINSSVNILVSNNTFCDNHKGISVKYSSTISLIKNQIRNNEYIGAHFLSSETNNISGNLFDNFNQDILLENSGYNIINNNIFSKDGLNFIGSNLEHFLQKEVINNTNNGETILFWQNKMDETISNKVCQVILVNCTNIILRGQKLSSSTAGVYLYYSKNITIIENTINGNIKRESVLVFASENVSVKGNYIYRSKKGISIISSQRCNIFDNRLISLSDEGIIVDYSFNNLLYRNTIDNSYNGIFINKSKRNQINFNKIYDNHNYGILFSLSQQNIIFENHIQSSFRGIFLESSSENIISKNNVTSNENIGIGLNKAFKNELSNNSIMNNADFGVFILNSNITTLLQNFILKNGYGVYLAFSFNSKIINNSILNNDNNGFTLFSSSVNEIINNSISHNQDSGIVLELSNLNTFEKNIIFNNKLDYAIILRNSNDNLFRFNILFENNLYLGGSQVFDKGKNNLFLKNFYSDLTNLDSNNDGLIDTPYKFDGNANNSDQTPLGTQNAIIIVTQEKTASGWNILIFIIPILFWKVIIRSRNKL